MKQTIALYTTTSKGVGEGSESEEERNQEGNANRSTVCSVSAPLVRRCHNFFPMVPFEKCIKFMEVKNDFLMIAFVIDVAKRVSCNRFHKRRDVVCVQYSRHVVVHNVQKMQRCQNVHCGSSQEQFFSTPAIHI